MDSQMQDNATFTDLLNEGSYHENELIGSPNPIDSTTEPQVEVHHSTKKARGVSFNKDEDLLLIDAWLNTTTNIVRGTDQSKNTYWSRIYDNYNANKTFTTVRNQVSLTNRWSVIQKAVNKFCGCLAQIELAHQSGLTEVDKIARARQLYKAENKADFQFEHCWIVLKECPKWLEEKESPNRSPFARRSTSSTRPSVNLGDDSSDTSNFVDLERPMGRKAAKERLHKQKSNVDADKESLVKILTQINERAQKTSEQKLEFMRRLDAREEAKIRFEEDKIVLMDTSDLSDIQKEYVRMREMEIIESRKDK